MINRHKLTVFFLFFLVSTNLLSAVDLLGEFQVDGYDNKVGGGVSIAVSETMRNALSLDGNLKYLGSNCYEASCIFYYTRTVFAIGGGFTYRLEKTEMYPGIKCSVLIIPTSSPISFNLDSSLFFKPKNVLLLQGFSAGLDLVIHTKNSDTSLSYDFRRNSDESLMENKLGMEVEAFQEGIPLHISLFASANFVKTDSVLIQSQAGGSLLWETKNGIGYYLKGTGYITGREHNNLPIFSIAAGVKLQLE